MMVDMRVALRCLHRATELLTGGETKSQGDDRSEVVRGIVRFLSTHLRNDVSAGLQTFKTCYDDVKTSFEALRLHGDQRELALASIEQTSAFWRRSLGEQQTSVLTSLQWLDDLAMWVRDAYGADCKRHCTLDAVYADASYEDGSDEEYVLDETSCAMMNSLVLFDIVELYAMNGAAATLQGDHPLAALINMACHLDESASVTSTTTTSTAPSISSSSSSSSTTLDQSSLDHVVQQVQTSLNSSDNRTYQLLPHLLLFAKLLCDDRSDAVDGADQTVPDWWCTVVSLLARYTCHANALLTMRHIGHVGEGEQQAATTSTNRRAAISAQFIHDFWNAHCWCAFCVVPFAGLRAVHDPLLQGTTFITLCVHTGLLRHVQHGGGAESDRDALTAMCELFSCDVHPSCSVGAHCDCALGDLALVDVPVCAAACSLLGVLFVEYTEKCSWFMGECALQRQALRHGPVRARPTGKSGGGGGVSSHVYTVAAAAATKKWVRRHKTEEWRVAHRSLWPTERAMHRDRTTTVFSTVPSRGGMAGKDKAMEALASLLSVELTLLSALDGVLQAHPHIEHRDVLVQYCRLMRKYHTEPATTTAYYERSFVKLKPPATSTVDRAAVQTPQQPLVLTQPQAPPPEQLCAVTSCQRSIVLVKDRMYNAFRCSATACEHHKHMALVCGKCFRAHWKPIFMQKWNSRRQVHVSKKRVVGLPLPCPRRSGGCTGYVRWVAHVCGVEHSHAVVHLSAEPKRVVFDHRADKCHRCTLPMSRKKKATASGDAEPTATTTVGPSSSPVRTPDDTDDMNSGNKDNVVEPIAAVHADERVCQRLQKAVSAREFICLSPPTIAAAPDRSYYEQCDALLEQLRACTTAAERLRLVRATFPRARAAHVALLVSHCLWNDDTDEGLMAQVAALAHVALS